MMGCQSSQVRRGHRENGTVGVGSRRLMNELFGLSVHVGRSHNVDLSSRQIDFLGPSIINIIQNDTLRRKTISLTLTDNLLYTLGKELLLLPDLEELDMDANRFQRLPQVLTKLPSLWRLNASANALDKETGFQILPQMQALRSLTLRMCSLVSIPDSLKNCPCLENLDLGDNPGMDIHTDTLSSMPRLRRLNIMNCDLYGSALPKSVKLVPLTMLNISGNYFTFDRDTFFGTLLPTTLQELFLCDMGLSAVPVAVVMLKKLWSLDLAQNPIETLDVLAGRIVKRLAQRRRGATASAMSSPNSPVVGLTSRRQSSAGASVCSDREEIFPAVEPVELGSEAFVDATESDWVDAVAATTGGANAKPRDSVTAPTGQSVQGAGVGELTEAELAAAVAGLSGGSPTAAPQLPHPSATRARSGSMTSVSDDAVSVVSRVSMSKLSKAGVMAHVAQPLQLKKLSLRACGLRTVPKYFHKMAGLEELDLSENEQLEDANMTLFSLDKLRVLNITDCPFAVDTSMSHNEWFDISKLRHLTDLQWEVWRGVHNASAYRTKIPLEICGLTLERINEVPLRPDLFVGDTVDTAVNLLRDGYYSIDLSMNENAVLSYVESLKIFATTEAFFNLPEVAHVNCESSTGANTNNNNNRNNNTTATATTAAGRHGRSHGTSPATNNRHSATADQYNHSININSTSVRHAAQVSLLDTDAAASTSAHRTSSEKAAASMLSCTAPVTTRGGNSQNATSTLSSLQNLRNTTTPASITSKTMTAAVSSSSALPIPTGAQLGTAHLHIAFHRYIFFLAMQAANYDAVIIPPLDVMTIHISQLTTHPLKYREDCDAICGRILNCNYRSFFLEERRHSAAARDAIAASKKIWNLMVRSAQRELRWLHYDFWEKLLRGVQDAVAMSTAVHSSISAEAPSAMQHGNIRADSNDDSNTYSRNPNNNISSSDAYVSSGDLPHKRRSKTTKKKNAHSNNTNATVSSDGTNLINGVLVSTDGVYRGSSNTNSDDNQGANSDVADCSSDAIVHRAARSVPNERCNDTTGADATCADASKSVPTMSDDASGCSTLSAAATTTSPPVAVVPDPADTVTTSIHLLPNLAQHRSDEVLRRYWQELRCVDSSADLAGVLDPSITYHFREHGEESIRSTLCTFYHRHRCFARHHDALRQLKLSWTRYAKFLVLYAYRRSVHCQSENTVIMNPMADENGHLFSPDVLPRRGQSALVRGASSKYSAYLQQSHHHSILDNNKTKNTSSSSSNNNNNNNNCVGSRHGGGTISSACAPDDAETATNNSSSESGSAHTTNDTFYPVTAPARGKSALVLPRGSISSGSNNNSSPFVAAATAATARHGILPFAMLSHRTNNRASTQYQQRLTAMREFTVDPIPTLGVLLLLYVHRTAHVRYVQTLSLLGVDAVDVQWRESARAMAQTRRAWEELYDDIYITDEQYDPNNRLSAPSTGAKCSMLEKTTPASPSTTAECRGAEWSQQGGTYDRRKVKYSAQESSPEAELSVRVERGSTGRVSPSEASPSALDRRPHRTYSSRSTGAASRVSSAHSDVAERSVAARRAKKSVSHLQRRRVKFCFAGVDQGIF